MRKQAKLAQWEELETAATSEDATTSTVLMCEEMHNTGPVTDAPTYCIHSIVINRSVYKGAPYGGIAGRVGV